MLMENSSVLVTGAGGELGSALISHLVQSKANVVALDLNPQFKSPLPEVHSVIGNICDQQCIAGLFEEHKFDTVFHFAALLSSAAEKDPFLSQQVNVDGTGFLLEQAYNIGKERGSPTRFLFPSSIAAYGTADTNFLRSPLREDQCLQPGTLYGIQKLFVEQLGTYFTKRSSGQFLDFRSLRYPGLISIHTLPTGGTSDYAAEMLHSANNGEAYACFVSADSSLPFMTMPDAVRALLMLAEVPQEALSQRVYNVRGFSVSAAELREEILEHFPKAEITFEPVEWRDQVVASWPDDIDDSLAQGDWGWKPDHDLKRAFTEYFLPGLVKHAEAQKSAAC